MLMLMQKLPHNWRLTSARWAAMIQRILQPEQQYLILQKPAIGLTIWGYYKKARNNGRTEHPLKPVRRA